jgi:hypothetical protein
MEVDLTPSPLFGEGSRDTNFGASHPSPFGEGLGVRSDDDIFYRAIHPYGIPPPPLVPQHARPPIASVKRMLLVQ